MTTSVCESASEHITGNASTSNLNKLCAYFLWPWLGPPLCKCECGLLLCYLGHLIVTVMFVDVRLTG